MISHKIHINDYNKLKHRFIICIYKDTSLIDILHVVYKYKAYRFRYTCLSHPTYEVLNYLLNNNICTVYKKTYLTEYYKGCPAIYKLKLTNECLISAL